MLPRTMCRSWVFRWACLHSRWETSKPLRGVKGCCFHELGCSVVSWRHGYHRCSNARLFLTSCCGSGSASPAHLRAVSLAEDGSNKALKIASVGKVHISNVLNGNLPGSLVNAASKLYPGLTGWHVYLEGLSVLAVAPMLCCNRTSGMSFLLHWFCRFSSYMHLTETSFEKLWQLLHRLQRANVVCSDQA